MGANLLVASLAERANSASAYKGSGHAITPLPLGDFAPHRFDHTRKFVAGNVGEHDVGIVTHPAMPVTAADPGRGNANDGAGGGRGRVRHRLDGERALKLGVEGGLQESGGMDGGWSPKERP